MCVGDAISQLASPPAFAPVAGMVLRCCVLPYVMMQVVILNIREGRLQKNSILEKLDLLQVATNLPINQPMSQFPEVVSRCSVHACLVMCVA